MAGGMRCSCFRMVLAALLLVALLQLLYLSLLSGLQGHPQQRWSHPGLRGTTRRAEPRWQREQKERLKAVLASGGILDSSGQYRIYRHLLAPEERRGGDASDVALASHASLNNLWHLQDLAERWDGRISLALFASSASQAELAVMLTSAVARLCPSVRRAVSFHLVCQSGDKADLPQPEEDSAPLHTCQDAFAKAAAMGAHAVNYADANASYPNNLLRNVARGGVASAFVLVVDVDMVPSQGLRAGFMSLRADPRTAYVVPAFEIRHTRRLPGTKDELLRLYQVGEVRAFYEELCPRCQAPTNYSVWLNLPQSAAEAGKIGVAYEVEWRDPWEPFYIGSKDVPPYDERFKQYGFNRISQACELNMAGFAFAVLDSAFLLHKGHKLPGDFHSRKDAENQRNRQLYRDFKKELKTRYPQSTRHC
ncbi:beta-1,4-glucuronyltransferase 1 [Gastrophryne carolinensis]